jgi:hypothetical protein
MSQILECGGRVSLLFSCFGLSVVLAENTIRVNVKYYLAVEFS